MMKGLTPQGVIGPTSTSTSIITLTALRRGALQPTIAEWVLATLRIKISFVSIKSNV